MPNEILLIKSPFGWHGSPCRIGECLWICCRLNKPFHSATKENTGVAGAKHCLRINYLLRPRRGAVLCGVLLAMPRLCHYCKACVGADGLQNLEQGFGSPEWCGGLWVLGPLAAFLRLNRNGVPLRCRFGGILQENFRAFHVAPI